MTSAALSGGQGTKTGSTDESLHHRACGLCDCGR